MTAYMMSYLTQREMTHVSFPVACRLKSDKLLVCLGLVNGVWVMPVLPVQQHCVMIPKPNLIVVLTLQAVIV
jgi:hypothetical protein